MTETLIGNLAQLGGTAFLGAILGLILYHQQKNYSRERAASDKRFEGLVKSVQDMVKADQDTREKHTSALVNMYLQVEQWNALNGINQKDCFAIRESFNSEIQSLKALREEWKLQENKSD